MLALHLFQFKGETLQLDDFHVSAVEQISEFEYLFLGVGVGV
jgi:hypothetical protein